MGGDETESKKKEKKDKGKDKDKDKHKDDKDKKDKGKDKHKDEKKDKPKDEKDKHKDEKDKGKDKHKDEKDKGKDKHKDEKDKGKDKHKDEKDKGKDKDKKDKKDEKPGGKEKEKDKKDKPSHPGGPTLGEAAGYYGSSGPPKDKKDKPSHPIQGEAASYYGSSGPPPQSRSQPAHPSQSGEAQWFLRDPGPEPIHGQQPQLSFPNPNTSYTSQPPPHNQPVQAVGGVGGATSAQNAPPSGFRLPLDPNAPLPNINQLGRPPATGFDGLTPEYIGSAIFPDSVQPCRIVLAPHPACRVLYGGSEVDHHGRYDLLPVTPDMEWVPASHGQIPPGRRPVDGGYESNGAKLYHALGFIQGINVPGKAGAHLGGAAIPFMGAENNIQENYSILCWR